jgi:chitosanase
MEIKDKILSVVNAFETAQAAGDYAAFVVMRDGKKGKDGKPTKQFTYGRSQVAEQLKMRDLLRRYCDAGGIYSEALKPYLEKIGIVPLWKDAVLKDLLVRAGKEDEVMHIVQDGFFDDHYYMPATAWCEKNGFMLPLSRLIIYDSFIHSGSILNEIRAKFAALPPAQGGDEKRWICNYVVARRAWLKAHWKPEVRKTTYRMDTFIKAFEQENWELLLPIRANGVTIK